MIWNNIMPSLHFTDSKKTTNKREREMSTLSITMSRCLFYAQPNGNGCCCVQYFLFIHYQPHIICKTSQLISQQLHSCLCICLTYTSFAILQLPLKKRKQGRYGINIMTTCNAKNATFYNKICLGQVRYKRLDVNIRIQMNQTDRSS